MIQPHIAARNAHSARRPRTPHARQGGAALIVGLVLMLALTVLGISGMNMATLELTMANNSQAQHLSFEAAETGIDLAIAQPPNPSSPATFGWTPVDADGTYETRADTDFVRTTLPPDGAFSTDMAAYHFDTEASGRGLRNAMSTHTQSFYVIGPDTTR